MTGVLGDDNRRVVLRSRRQRLRDLWRRVVIRATLLDLSRARLLRDKPGIVDDLIELGRRRIQRLDADQAESAFLQARELATKLDYDIGIARSSIGLSGVARLRQDFEAAAGILEPELHRMRRLPDKVFLAYALNNLGEALVPAHRLTAAANAFREAESVSEQIGNWREKVKALSGLASVDYAAERFEGAFERWSRAVAVYRRHLDVGGTARMQHWLSMAAGKQGRVAEAREIAVQSLRNYERAGRPDIADEARDYLAKIDEFINDGGTTTSDDQG